MKKTLSIISSKYVIIAVFALLLTGFLFAFIETPRMTAYAYSEEVNLMDLRWKGVWDYSKYNSNYEYIESSGGFGNEERQTEATIYVTYRVKNKDPRRVNLYAIEADHTKGLETAVSIYNRQLTEEEYTYAVECDNTFKAGCKYAKLAFNIGCGNIWGDSNSTERKVGDTVRCAATDANEHIVGQASGLAYTYYILTLKVERDLVTDNSNKNVVGYKNYRATVQKDLSGEYLSYQDLTFEFFETKIR